MSPKLLIPLLALHAWCASHAADRLAGIKSRADLERVIASTADVTLKQALQENSDLILAAMGQASHADAVTQTVESARGKVEKTNLTPESLKKAVAGDLAIFDTLKLVDLSVPNAGPHDKRTSDPY